MNRGTAIGSTLACGYGGRKHQKPKWQINITILV
jgi:hypothetical protein